MHKSKKQLLGVVGLALVAIITAIACAIPTPRASATNYDIKVQVNVGTDLPLAQILAPADGAEFVTSVVTYKYQLYNVSKAISTLTCDCNGEPTTTVISERSPIENGVIYEEQINLENVSGMARALVACDKDSEIKISLAGLGAAGTELTRDAVAFRYRSVKLSVDTNADQDGNPIATVTTENTVYSLSAQVYDSKGNPVFVDKNGKEEPIIINRAQLEAANFKYDFVLPMTKYNAPAGTYRLYVEARDESGENILSINLQEFKYEPKAPDTPNTGFIFGDLNIARADFIITGVIIFGIVAVGAAYLILRKRHN